jgi:hypothetical protein
VEFLNPLSLSRALALFPEKRLEGICLATDQVFDCVYIRGDLDPSGKYRVGKADPYGLKMPAVGVITEKTSPTECVFQWIGELGGFPGLISGKTLWVGLDGKLTHTMPSSPAYQQCMGAAVSSTTVLLNNVLLSTATPTPPGDPLGNLIITTEGDVVYDNNEDILVQG